MPKDSRKISEKIKEIRNSHNLSQDRFAMKIGLSGKTISAYETGRAVPPLKILEKIVDVYDTPIIQMKPERKDSLKKRLFQINNEVTEIISILGEDLIM